MKTKILPAITILLLIGTTLNVIAVNSDDDNTIEITATNENFMFSEATIKEKDGYLTLKIDEAESYLMNPGKPMVPVYVKTYIFPFGTKIKNVECTPVDVTSESIYGKIQPAPQAVPRISLKTSSNETDTQQTLFEDKSVYDSSEVYPENWYDYKISCGLNNGEDVIFLKIWVYPIRYSPLINTFYSTKDIDVKIIYENPENLVKVNATYDLVIIAPDKFYLPLLPLVLHKNLNGVATLLKTTESIYSKYTGRDKPERIKYFIKDAKEKFGIKYVLLVGGLKSHFNADDRDDCNQGSKDWYLPVRYTNIVDFEFNNSYSVGCISDLYYADLYRYNTSSGEEEFEDWDSNGNDIFAEGNITWNPGWFEEMDLYPDVYYGRLACRNILEVQIMVNKIIRYERSSHKNDPWFKKMIAVGGKTFGIYEGQPDGEYLCNYSLDLMQDIIDNPVRVFASNNGTGGPRPIPKDIIKEFSRGAGFVLFQGHGNPYAWDTIWVDGTYPKDWTGGISVFDFWRLNNGNKLPIVVVGGCHNALFNVTLVKTLLNYKEPYYYWAYGVPIRECFSWRLCVKPIGGAIASTGCTGLGQGYLGDPISLSGELESNFFYKIGKDNVTTLGEAHSGSIEKYLSENDLTDESAIDVYCITIYQLFGDPSLRIGGYL
jgi:hypothetical protein